MTDAVASDGHGWITTKRVASASAIGITLMGAAALITSSDRLVGSPINSITSLLEGRSPGERGTAALTKLRKEAIKKIKREEVHQRVLGKVFPPIPPKSVPPQELLEFGPPSPFEALEFPGIALPEIAERSATLNGGPPFYGPLIARTGSGPGNGGSGSGDGSGGGIGGDIGGGTGGTPVVGSVTPLVPEVSSAVPEPGTWALMLLGSFLSAAALRRDKPRRRRRPAIGTLA